MMHLPKILIAIGLSIAAFGAIMLIAGKVPGLDRLGRLPGDINYERGGVRVYFPWVTCLVLSALLSFFFSGGCTFEKEESAETAKLREKLATAEKELTVLEDKMKDPTIEGGLKDRLQTERELMKSRLERIRENLEASEKKPSEH